MNEVDESIADIGMISEVNGEVKEVVPAGVVLVDLLQQRRLVVLVGDVLNHHARSQILGVPDALELDLVMARVHVRVVRVVLPQLLVALHLARRVFLAAGDYVEVVGGVRRAQGRTVEVY